MSQPAHEPNESDIKDAVKSATPSAPRANNATGNKTCRYFLFKSGCKAGDKCPYKHEVSTQQAGATSARKTTNFTVAPDKHVSPRRPGQRRYQAPVVPASKVVPRPVPTAQLEDPREFQLGQIRRRFSPAEKDDPASGTSFTFKLVPSDPDFPYEIDALECVLLVPPSYPKDDSVRPRLRITNKEMRRGFQINVENGFDEIAAASPTATLLGLMNRLDKALADALSRPMAETVKLYRHAGTISTGTGDATKTASASGPSATAMPSSGVPIPSRPAPAIVAQPSYSSAEKIQAGQKRQADIRQLVARLGKSPGFHQANDGVSFTLPPSVFRVPTAPVSISRATSLQLVVPELYNLVHCQIRFGEERTDEVQNAEAAFEARTKSNKDGSLLAHVNYLSQNLKSMAAQTRATVQETTASAAQAQPPPETDRATLPDEPVVTPAPELQNTDKPHIKVIPRPLEWTQAQTLSSDEDSSDLSYSEDSDFSDDEDVKEGVAIASAPVTGTAEKGIMLSFPNLELHGIELLELQSLSLTVKCDRCKELNDFERIRNNSQGDHTGMKEQNCKKCGSSLAVGYRMDLIHVNSSRAGYLDLDGCTTVDVLPSTFVPTCSECSTAYTTPGCISVRGDSSMAVCRECHRKMSFRIYEVKFLMVSAAAERATQGPIRRKVKENLGIVAGQELPRRGKCQHYSKSYRWFRFSCCSKVYPCDRCHDNENPNHTHEFANRMICGYCSREQNYRPEDCGVCHSVLIGKKGHGFWEGGKGTSLFISLRFASPAKVVGYVYDCSSPGSPQKDPASPLPDDLHCTWMSVSGEERTPPTQLRMQQQSRVILQHPPSLV
ncbi:hypothetical protein BDZ85DRAFT_262229 [Elsinoe ampelina]|uniref:CHY-type domain-containing protein n=1 Tax=Elsinoe ampelina TaxID=302913 RepID=A0A6A6GE88_9PEZI|nr:hypothetical protein BDZ85DRAFT_262229 [Elsinoe ampelina]